MLMSEEAMKKDKICIKMEKANIKSIASMILLIAPNILLQKNIHILVFYVSMAVVLEAC